jgi:Leucine-rich repeat (LRR) protein
MDGLLPILRITWNMERRLQSIVEWNSSKHIITSERVDMLKDQTIEGMSLLDSFRRYLHTGEHDGINRFYMTRPGAGGPHAKNPTDDRRAQINSTLQGPETEVYVLPPNTEISELQALDLSNNRLRSLNGAIAGCKNLVHLDLHCNALGADGAAMLPPQISSLRYLAWLDLSSNSGESVTPEISLCPALQHLNLSNNKLTALGRELAAMPAIETLDLSSNYITHCTSLIGQCASLRALDLSLNRLKVLPPSIADCAGLRHLHLFNNRLTSLPFTLAWLLPQLMSFDVGKNPLRGLPPKWVNGEVLGATAILSMRFSRERK